MNTPLYAATERLRDGSMLHIRAMRPTDRSGFLAVFEGTSDQTRYRRFFAPKNAITEAELDFFLNIDFVNHVALAAILEENDARQLVVGGGRYFVGDGGCAELAFTVVDTHQRLGIGTHLMRHLILIARAAGLRAFEAEVLPDNVSMLKVFERCGLAMTTRHETGVTRLRLDLTIAQSQDSAPQRTFQSTASRDTRDAPRPPDISIDSKEDQHGRQSERR